jgi:hypothetical protein
MNEQLKGNIADYQNQLTKLLSKRDEINKEIGYVTSMLRALAQRLPDDAAKRLTAQIRGCTKPVGLTDEVMQVLRVNRARKLSAKEVCKKLQEYGTDLSGYSQPLGTVSITLKRLAKSNSLVRRTTDGRSVFYRFQFPIRPLTAGKMT